ncbi:hypothetical protein KL953_34650 [Mycolicibacterium goodii]|uniref:hypothetical protein n=1 Tax=Mycolicibacterium goodii TaxID=134601 RepID=UPI001BDC09B4|nr:hypothetical protein [Mycolicibacterium goodii]MBU8814004.1 hypothetical protein [Mycolicibacterium goodii]
MIDTAEAAFITDPGIFFQYVRPGPPTKFAMLAPTDDKPCAAAPSPDPAIAWPDSLHNEVDLKELLDKHATPQQFPIALQDDPHSRTQRPCFVDAGRNTVIVRDSPRSGSQLVQATVLSIAEQNSPSDVHIYVLSGEPGWSELANLAHVGACILAGDSDEDRLVKWLNGVVDDRIATSTGNAPEMPRQPETSTDIYLVITDALARTRWGRDAPESFERIVTNGPRVGVYTIAIEARDGWTRGPTPDWSVLDLSLSSRGGPRSVIATPHHEDLAAAVQAINHKWTGHQRATPIPALPEHISLREIQDTMPAQPDDSAKQRWRIACRADGVDAKTVGPQRNGGSARPGVRRKRKRQNRNVTHHRQGDHRSQHP